MFWATFKRNAWRDSGKNRLEMIFLLSSFSHVAILSYVCGRQMPVMRVHWHLVPPGHFLSLQKGEIDPPDLKTALAHKSVSGSTSFAILA